MFYVGQKVVCVDDSPARLLGSVLKKGEVYTVDGFDLDTEPDRAGLILCEIVSPQHIFGHFMGFRPERFRPLTDQKKSVSFTIGADPDSERWDNRRKVVEPFPVDGWGA